MAQRQNYNKGDAKIFMVEALRQYNLENSSKFTGKPTSLLRLAKLHNVSYKSLQRRVSKEVQVDSHAGHPPILTQMQEQELVDCLKLLAEGGFGQSNCDIIKFVNGYLTNKNVIATGPSESWVTKFLKKYKDQLSRRKSKTNHQSRFKSASKTILDDFFSLLSDNFMNVNQTTLKYILWNADEAGFAPVLTHKTIIAARGARNVQSITFNNSHEYTTVHVCANANGDIMKPFVLYKKTIPDVSQLWDGAEYRSSFSGWMMTHNFIDWIQNVFYPTACQVSDKYIPEYNGPFYLIVDGHTSHTNVDVVLLAKNLNIKLIKLPAHSTHFLQPLDVGFFGPVKKLWYSEVEEYSKFHTRAISKSDFSLILERLWSKIKSDYVVNGFKKTGIFPIDINAISSTNLNMAIPWTDEGFQSRFGDEINQCQENEQPFESYCLKTMQKIMSPPVTTQIRPVITREQRMQRGSGLSEILTERPALGNIDINVPQIPQKLCEICQLTGSKNCIWINCLTCHRKMHKKCCPIVKNKNEKQIRKSNWLCPFCSMTVNNYL